MSAYQASELETPIKFVNSDKKPIAQLLKQNVNKISIKLNQLNYLIGKEDLYSAIVELFDETKKDLTIEILQKIF